MCVDYVLGTHERSARPPNDFKLGISFMACVIVSSVVYSRSGTGFTTQNVV